jgi:hypothetical protein
VRRSLEENILLSLYLHSSFSFSLSLSLWRDNNNRQEYREKNRAFYSTRVQRENLPFLLWAAAPPFFEAKMTGQLFFFLLDLLKKRLFDLTTSLTEGDSTHSTKKKKKRT